MDALFACYGEFGDALSEIEVLVQIAGSYERDVNKYSIFNKSAILLLLAKFENFLEIVVLEYVSNLVQLKLYPDLLPETMKIQSTNSALSDQFFTRLRNLKPSAIKELKLIMPLWSPSSRLDSIYVDNRFDYGKHGPNEIRKLFKRIGIENIFEVCPVYEEKETLTRTTKVRVKINLVADIHAMTNHRNNIIHEDRSPSLTHYQIRIYRNRLLSFAGALVKFLGKNIRQIKRKS